MDESTTKRCPQRANKPLTEKKRRLRINASLDQIKCLIMDALGHDSTSVPTKFEKADILELAVRYLEGQRAVNQPIGSNLINQYKEGYQACINDVKSYLNQVGAGSKFRSSMIDHLEVCCTNLSTGSIMDMVLIPTKNSARTMDYVDGSAVMASPVSHVHPLQDLNQNIVQHHCSHSAKDGPMMAILEERMVQHTQENIIPTASGSMDVRVARTAVKLETNTTYATRVMSGLPPIQSFAPVQNSTANVFQPLMETQEVTENNEESYQTFTVLQPVKQEPASMETNYYGLYHHDQGFV